MRERRVFHFYIAYMLILGEFCAHPEIIAGRPALPAPAMRRCAWGRSGRQCYPPALRLSTALLSRAALR